MATLFIVSLGPFERRRYPDLEVRDDCGHKLTLLTRQQHGYCLVHGILQRYLSEEEWLKVLAEYPPSPVARALDTLVDHLFTMVTSVSARNDPLPETVEEDLTRLLRALGVPADRCTDASRSLKTGYGFMAKQTQYLCWVAGEPGETVQLEVSYTLSDAPDLMGPALTEPELVRDSRRQLIASWALRARMRWRNWRIRRYAALGLLPLYYQIHAPSRDHAGSYYFTFAPPVDVDVAFMDWGRGRCFEKASNGVDCAHHTCHIHNTDRSDDPSAIAGSAISVFVRATPTDHGKLGGVALLSLGLAFMAQSGDLKVQSGSTYWLLLAPAAIVVFIGLQRQHHYGRLLRPLRAVMWTYVAVHVIFAASVSFDPVKNDKLFGRANILDDVASGVLALSSAALLLVLFSSSSRYDRRVRLLFERMFVRARVFKVWSRLRQWQRYPRPWKWPDNEERERRLEELPDDGTRSYDTANMYAYVARQYVDRRIAEAAALLLVLAICGYTLGDGWGSGRVAKLTTTTARERGVKHRPGMPAKAGSQRAGSALAVADGSQSR